MTFFKDKHIVIPICIFLVMLLHTESKSLSRKTRSLIDEIKEGISSLKAQIKEEFEAFGPETELKLGETSAFLKNLPPNFHKTFSKADKVDGTNIFTNGTVDKQTNGNSEMESVVISRVEVPSQSSEKLMDSIDDKAIKTKPRSFEINNPAHETEDLYLYAQPASIVKKAEPPQESREDNKATNLFLDTIKRYVHDHAQDSADTMKDDM